MQDLTHDSQFSTVIRGAFRFACVALVSLAVCGVTGCPGKEDASTETEVEFDAAAAKAEADAQAEKEITEANAEETVGELEKEIESDLSEEQ